MEIDLTAADALEEVRQTLQARGVMLAVARGKRELLESLRATGFTDRV